MKKNQKRQNGFTMVELLIVIAIAVIVIFMGTQIFSGHPFNISGVTCNHGYKFIYSEGGSHQMLDDNGKGIRCDAENSI